MENLIITESIKNSLLAASKWLNFLTVLAIIGAAFIGIAGICLLLIPMAGMERSGAMGGLLGIIYIILALVYIYPIKKSLSAIRNTQDALYASRQESLDTAATNIHELLRYLGIMSIVILSIYLLIFIIAMVIAALT